MNGKIAVITLALTAVIGGGAAYYLQVYGFYDRLPQATVALSITAVRPDGNLTTLPVTDADGIDANSSPLRWRACFTLAQPADPAALTPYPAATPLVGPGWFPCYDAGVATAALASGEAKAYLSASNVRPDVDRVIALWPDGRGVGWHQYNDKTPDRGVMD